MPRKNAIEDEAMVRRYIGEKGKYLRDEATRKDIKVTRYRCVVVFDPNREVIQELKGQKDSLNGTSLDEIGYLLLVPPGKDPMAKLICLTDSVRRFLGRIFKEGEIHFHTVKKEKPTEGILPDGESGNGLSKTSESLRAMKTRELFLILIQGPDGKSENAVSLWFREMFTLHRMSIKEHWNVLKRSNGSNGSTATPPE